MLQTYVPQFKGNWDSHLSLMEFDCSNSYNSDVEMASLKIACNKIFMGWSEGEKVTWLRIDTSPQRDNRGY